MQTATKSGLRIHLKPMTISDEPLVRTFMASLSQESLYFKLFRHARLDEEFIRRLATFDPTKQAAALALMGDEGEEQADCRQKQEMAGRSGRDFSHNGKYDCADEQVDHAGANYLARSGARPIANFWEQAAGGGV